jgi:hypothetical protein
LEECSIEIDLDCVQVELNAEVVEETDGVETHNWAVCVSFVGCLALQVASDDKAGLLLLFGSVGKEFSNESPHEGDDCLGWVFGDKLEGLSFAEMVSASISRDSNQPALVGPSGIAQISR